MNRIMTEDIDRILAENLSWEKFKGTRTLITGASGMLGGYMLNVLISLREKHGFDMELYGLVRNPDKLPGEVRDKIHVIRQSVVDPIPDDLEPDHVIHTASPASPLIMREDPVGTIAANTIGTYNTLEAARKGSRKGYLFISSREIYGQPYDDQRVFTEDTYGFVDPLDPRSCYPEGTKAAETMCVSFKKQYGINVKIARLAHTFGPGMSVDDGRVQADFLRNVINNENIVLKSDGSAIRTYTYVADAVSALFRILLDSDDVVYNISSEDSTVSIRELAQTLVDIYPERDLELEFHIPEDSGNSGCAPFTLGILGSDKLKALGWTPIYSLKEGLKRTVDFLEDVE